MIRLQQEKICQDLEKKMVFIVGPRQVGKTSLSKQIAKNFKHSLYLNFDDIDDRITIQKKLWPINLDLLILDELHKMPDWKNFLKGVYDTKPESMRLLITGSARLSVYERTGDSLAGRYYCHHLMPLSLSELSKAHEKIDIDRLMIHGGFPEPYFLDSVDEAKRWRSQYIQSMIRTDVLDFAAIKNVTALQNTFEMLRRRVGSPISYQSIAEDLQVSQPTIKNYIDILEALYLVFRVRPYSKNIARSLLKEPKIYFFDTGLVQGSEGAQLENLVAVSLLKSVYAARDYQGAQAKLAYLRTKDQKEVDFGIIHDDQIKQLIEVKLSDRDLSQSLVYFAQKYQLSAIQIVKNLQKPKQIKDIKIIPLVDYLKELAL